MPKLLSRNDNIDRMIREKVTHEKHTGQKCVIRLNEKLLTWELWLTEKSLRGK